MSNAVNKLILTVASAAVLTGCGDSDAVKAKQLADRASQLIEAGDFGGAVVMLDSLDSTYPREIEVRKTGLLYRGRAVERLARDSIIIVDNLLSQSVDKRDSMSDNFVTVELPGGIAGYKVAKSIQGKKSLNTTGIQPRIGVDDDYLSLAVNIKGRSIGFNRITVKDGDRVVSTIEIKPDRLVKVENSEMVTLTQEESAPLIECLEANPGIKEYKLCGTRGSIDIKLTSEMRQALIESYRYALACQETRLALIKRERFERMLQRGRDFIANSIEDTAQPGEN